MESIPKDQVVLGIQSDLESAVKKILTACDETLLSPQFSMNQPSLTHLEKKEFVEGEKYLQSDLGTHKNEATPESSEDDEKMELQMGNNFSVIHYNKARGSLPRRTRRKNKLSPLLEIDPTLSLSDIVIPTSASAVSDEGLEEVKDVSNETSEFLKHLRTPETPVPRVIVPVPLPTANNQFMTKLCSKMNNIQQTCFEDPFLHDVLDDMKVLQQAMTKLCRRAMLQTDDELFTD